MLPISDSSKILLTALLISVSLCVLPKESVASDVKLPPLVENYSLPEKVELCGEPLPLEDQHVREMLDREFTISVWNRGQVLMWLKRAGKYFPYIEKQLARAGLPDDIKYLAVAESALIPYIRSSAGAIGLWQFMPGTGRKYGLKKVYGLDERREYEQATRAAVKYLTFLYEKFGSWSLALGAYNCGERRVEKALEKQNVDNYYRLNLPMETERFVYRIAAIKLILQNPEKYGYRVASSDIYPPLRSDAEHVRLSTPVDIAEAARELGTDYKMLKELNPHILGSYFPSGEYILKTPPGKGAELPGVLEKLAQRAAMKYGFGGKHYEVRRGDTLSKIARKTGANVSSLKRLNRIQGDLIHAGQRLRLR